MNIILWKCVATIYLEGLFFIRHYNIHKTTVKRCNAEDLYKESGFIKWIIYGPNLYVRAPYERA